MRQSGQSCDRSRTDAIQRHSKCKRAWEIVKASECENAKIILDSWHWLRANQLIDLCVLEGIPADKIVSVQINDVYERAYAENVLRDESMHDRLAPGTGCGDTAAFCRMT